MSVFAKRLGLDRAAVGYGLRLALSAWLAFSIAAVLHVQNAFWAPMAIWVVAQTSRGLMLERAVFRVAGTLVGAGLGFGILHLIASPYPQLLMLGVVVALGAGSTHILRGAYSYFPFMAGMTAAVVVLPSLVAPAHSTELAIARVECTLIGVVVVTVVMGLTTPGSARGDFYRRVRGLTGDAVAFAARIIEVERGPDAASFERRILAEMNEVDAAAALVSAGSLEGHRRLKHVDAMIAASLDVMAAGRAVRARQRRGESPPVGLIEMLKELSTQIHSQLPVGVELPVEWYGKPVNPEVRHLLDALEQLAVAQKALFSDSRAADATALQRNAMPLAPQRDWQLARRAGITAGVATALAGYACYLSGWYIATLAAMGVCTFSMVLGSMPMPHKVAPKIFIGVVVGVLAATCYRFAIQPYALTTTALVLSALPFVLVGGLARASRESAIAIASVDGNMCFLLASQIGMPAAGTGEITGGSVAMIAGAGLVAAWFLLLPPRSSHSARDAARTIQRDFERLIASDTSVPHTQWQAQTSRQILRLMLHLGRAGRLGEEAPDGLLAVLNLGHSIVALQHQSQQPQRGEVAVANAQQALQTLTAHSRNPQQAVAQLNDQSSRIDDADVRRAVEMAADALNGGATFFAFVRERA